MKPRSLRWFGAILLAVFWAAVLLNRPAQLPISPPRKPVLSLPITNRRRRKLPKNRSLQWISRKLLNHNSSG